MFLTFVSYKLIMASCASIFRIAYAVHRRKSAVSWYRNVPDRASLFVINIHKMIQRSPGGVAVQVTARVL